MRPKRLTKVTDRQMARYDRDECWNFMARVIQCGTIWFCPWDKYHRHEEEAEKRKAERLRSVYGPVSPLLPCGPCDSAMDEDIHCLMSGMDRLSWLGKHPDWWVIGEWVEERCARPITITEAGILAFLDWPLYDQEDVKGGGYVVKPGNLRYDSYTGPCPECAMPVYSHAGHCCPAKECSGTHTQKDG